MKDLNQKGCYTVPDRLKVAIGKEFWAGCCDDDRAAKTISKVWAEHHYLCGLHSTA